MMHVRLAVLLATLLLLVGRVGLAQGEPEPPVTAEAAAGTEEPVVEEPTAAVAEPAEAPGGEAEATLA